MADDSLTIQRVINLTFADEGIDVIVAGDGDAALREIEGSRPDIVLADVHMPGPSGYEICSLLRSREETVLLPVILLVGSFEPFDPEEAERVGADAFVTKPFQSIRQLVDQVKELLGPPKEAERPEEKNHEFEPAPAETAAPRYDTTDIDNLYDRSFAETVEMPAEMAAQMAATGYAADRLDDEMIETSY
ncbi:MAG: PleD family two-component system response regulator, partial [Pyrinomonadaceae bacterium]